MNRGFNDAVKIRYMSEELVSVSDFMEHRKNENVADVKILSYGFETSRFAFVGNVRTPFSILDEAGLNISLNTSLGTRQLYNLLEAPIFIMGFDVSLIDYVNSKPYLIEGRLFENDDECVISIWGSNAEIYWSNLEIGDTIVFNDNNGVFKEFTIVGFVRENINEDKNNIQGVIYTTIEGAEIFDPLVEPFIGFRLSGYFPRGYEAVIFLESHENYNAFQDDIVNASKPHNPPRYLGISTSRYVSGVYEDYIYPAEDNLDTLLRYTTSTYGNPVAYMFLIRVFVVSVAIISTVSLLNNRKYEIAVLLSCGMKKSRLVFSYLIEILALVWGVTVISFLSAQVISIMFADSLFNIQGVFSIENIDGFFESLRFLAVQNIVSIFINTSVVAAISVVLACIGILRFEPLKIFNKRY